MNAMERMQRRIFRDQQKQQRLLKKYGKPRGYAGRCEECGCKEPKPVQYIDESNIAITYNSPYLCRDCYIKKYGA